MVTLRAYRNLLTNGPLVRLLGGEFVSSIGDWLYLVALLIVVYQRSPDPVLLGVVGAARVLPYVVLSVPAGIAADRFDRRLILIVTDAARGVIMLGLAWLVATNGPIEAIVGLAILATCFSTFFGPTIGAYLPGLVRDERELAPANSAWATLDNLAFALGPAIAGILVGLGGLTLAFLLNAASFAIVAVVLAGLPSVRPAASAATPDEATEAPLPPPAMPDVRRATAAVAGLGLIDVVGSFAFGGLGILTVTLAVGIYDAGDAGVGALNAAIGLGGLIGAVASGPLALRPALGRILLGGIIAMAAGIVGLGLTTSLAAGFAAMVVASAGSLLIEVTSTTIFQRVVPDAVRGRVLGVLATITTLAFAAGAFAIPVIADALGPAPVLIATSVALLMAGLVGRALVGPIATSGPAAEPGLVAELSALPIFVGVSPARLERAAALMRSRPVRSGERIITEGAAADRFYVVRDGRFRVTQAGASAPLRDMPPGSVFGEIGLLRRSPRTATVTALTDGLLLELDGPAFLQLVSSDSGLGPRLLELHRGGTAEPVSAG